MIATELRLLDAADVPWIARLVDLAERSSGEPWRVLLERVEHRDEDVRVHASRVAGIVGALRRMAAATAESRRIARAARSLVLGHPALDRDSRDARLAAAACALELTPAEVERGLWADLAMERPVRFPAGRPDELALAALANLDRVQRVMRRARGVVIAVPGPAHDLVRMIARCGLLAAISHHPDSTRLDITGPLALFHATTVYGRALAALVPLLAEHDDFALEIQCELRGRPTVVRVEPPVLLPAARPPRRRRITFADQLARDLEEAGYRVARDPDPIRSGERLLFPDVAIERGDVRAYVEIVGFSTTEYVAQRLARYRDVGHRVVLCVDAGRGTEPVIAVPGVVAFRRRVDIRRIQEELDG